MAYNSYAHLTYSNLKRLERVKTAHLKRMLCVSKYTPNRITYILAITTVFIEDLMAAHNLVPSLQSTRFLEDRGQKSRNIDQRMERSQLPVAPPVQESSSPQTTPTDKRNQGFPQPQRTMPMHPLRKKLSLYTMCLLNPLQINYTIVGHFPSRFIPKELIS